MMDYDTLVIQLHLSGEILRGAFEKLGDSLNDAALITFENINVVASSPEFTEFCKMIEEVEISRSANENPTL